MKKLLLTFLLILSMLTGCSDEKKVTNKEITIMFQDNEYTGKYTGLLVKGIPTGEATFVLDDGTIVMNYEGNFENGEFKGPGKLETNNYIMKYTNLDRLGQYSGDVLDGLPSGNGVFTTINDENQKYTYTGEFLNGSFNGQGKREFEDRKYYSRIENGTWIDNIFTPTPKEYFLTESTSGYIDFSIPEKSLTFLEEHPNFFPAQSLNEINEYIDTTIEPKYLDKSHSNFGDKLVKIEDVTIYDLQFYEKNTTQITIMQGHSNSSFMYYIYYFGDIDVYEDDHINLYALPIGKGKFYHTMGSSFVPMYVASYIEKR